MASSGLSETESKATAHIFLENILEHPDVRPEGWDEEGAEREAEHGYCVECGDQPAEVRCETCTDDYCDVCFSAQHRKGSRKGHTAKSLAAGETSLSKPSQNGVAHAEPNGQEVEMEDGEAEGEVDTVSPPPAPISDIVLSSQPALGSDPGEWFVERAKYIPLRLTFVERKYLRLLEAALQVSEYTDKIDTLGYGLSKAKRIVHQIRELCAILLDSCLPQITSRAKSSSQIATLPLTLTFTKGVELGRRHKIMNPDKMRTTYGKLSICCSQSPEVREMLEFTHGLLDEYDVLDLLRDPLITTATQEIVADKRSRREIQTLSGKYSREPKLPRESVRQALYSIGDNHAFLRTNRDPCDRMISYLQQYSTQRSLAIRNGRGGARLSHDHARQYAHVHLWSLAEQDLLSETVPYRLRDTGQGLNRVQAAHKTSRMMHAILNRAQKSLGGWVGSSVIHMGDHNVPNALMFIDKYSQIYRILLPYAIRSLTCHAVRHACAARIYRSEYGSLDALYLDILGDFFRHAFDGSGADNFYDAGSCIDGRLTSAWNWCSSLEKKRFFHVFLLTGFNGFDGEW
ncbi:hypothetical protein EI94DRAFT_1739579 [Lactarius quietus]|nr:hypothetical protein EI94DRAFT_1739579 [Lactarius quietus]